MNKKILYILRGVPGSGKSTYAKEIMTTRCDSIGEHYEADMYFMDNGIYNWNADKLYYAHTFVLNKDIKPYIKAAEERGWEVSVLRLSNNFNNVHSVPAEVVQAMLDKFQDYPGEIKLDKVKV